MTSKIHLTMPRMKMSRADCKPWLAKMYLSRLKPTIYCTRGKHVKHYSTKSVDIIDKLYKFVYGSCNVRHQEISATTQPYHNDLKFCSCMHIKGWTIRTLNKKSRVKPGVLKEYLVKSPHCKIDPLNIAPILNKIASIFFFLIKKYT